MARYISVESSDKETATIDFLGSHGCTVKATLEKNQKTGKIEIYVVVNANDDAVTILGEILAEVPESDECEEECPDCGEPIAENGVCQNCGYV